MPAARMVFFVMLVMCILQFLLSQAHRGACVARERTLLYRLPLNEYGRRPSLYYSTADGVA
jgi:hypothetical protein